MAINNKRSLPNLLVELKRPPVKPDIILGRLQVIRDFRWLQRIINCGLAPTTKCRQPPELLLGCEFKRSNQLFQGLVYQHRTQELLYRTFVCKGKEVHDNIWDYINNPKYNHRTEYPWFKIERVNLMLYYNAHASHIAANLLYI